LLSRYHINASGTNVLKKIKGGIPLDPPN